MKKLMSFRLTKTVALAATMLALVVAVATTAFGSQSENSNAPSSNTYITRSGVLVEGDTQVDCRGFDQAVEQYKNAQPANSEVGPELKQAKEALRYCKDHGYKSTEDLQSKSSPVKGSLPDTGGFDLLTLTAGGLLVAGGFLYRKFSL